MSRQEAKPFLRKPSKTEMITEEVELIHFAEAIEAVAVIALFFGIISLALSGHSDSLQKQLIITTDPSTKGDLETQIDSLNTASMVFKVLDIILVLAVIVVNAEEILKSFKLLKDLSFRKVKTGGSWFSKIFGA